MNQPGLAALDVGLHFAELLELLERIGVELSADVLHPHEGAPVLGPGLLHVLYSPSRVLRISKCYFMSNETLLINSFNSDLD